MGVYLLCTCTRAGVPTIKLLHLLKILEIAVTRILWYTFFYKISGHGKKSVSFYEIHVHAKEFSLYIDLLFGAIIEYISMGRSNT